MAALVIALALAVAATASGSGAPPRLAGGAKPKQRNAPKRQFTSKQITSAFDDLDVDVLWRAAIWMREQREARIAKDRAEHGFRRLPPTAQEKAYIKGFDANYNPAGYLVPSPEALGLNAGRDRVGDFFELGGETHMMNSTGDDDRFDLNGDLQWIDVKWDTLVKYKDHFRKDFWQQLKLNISAMGRYLARNRVPFPPLLREIGHRLRRLGLKGGEASELRG